MNLSTKFKDREEVLAWLHRRGDMDLAVAEAIVGYDAYGRPVVDRTIEVTNRFMWIEGSPYAGDLVSHHRQKACVEAMRMYAMLRCVEPHTPFVVKWTLHQSPSGGCCCGSSPIKPCKRTAYVDLTKSMPRLEGWLP